MLRFAGTKSCIAYRQLVACRQRYGRSAICIARPAVCGNAGARESRDAYSVALIAAENHQVTAGFCLANHEAYMAAALSGHDCDAAVRRACQRGSGVFVISRTIPMLRNGAACFPQAMRCKCSAPRGFVVAPPCAETYAHVHNRRVVLLARNLRQSDIFSCLSNPV